MSRFPEIVHDPGIGAPEASVTTNAVSHTIASGRVNSATSGIRAELTALPLEGVTFATCKGSSVLNFHSYSLIMFPERSLTPSRMTVYQIPCSKRCSHGKKNTSFSDAENTAPGTKLLRSLATVSPRKTQRPSTALSCSTGSENLTWIESPIVTVTLPTAGLVEMISGGVLSPSSGEVTGFFSHPANPAKERRMEKANQRNVRNIAYLLPPLWREYGVAQVERTLG